MDVNTFRHWVYIETEKNEKSVNKLSITMLHHFHCDIYPPCITKHVHQRLVRKKRSLNYIDQRLFLEFLSQKQVSSYTSGCGSWPLLLDNTKIHLVSKSVILTIIIWHYSLDFRNFYLNFNGYILQQNIFCWICSQHLNRFSRFSEISRKQLWISFQVFFLPKNNFILNSN